MRENKNVPKEAGFGFGTSRIEYTCNRSVKDIPLSSRCLCTMVRRPGETGQPFTYTGEDVLWFRALLVVMGD